MTFNMVKSYWEGVLYENPDKLVHMLPILGSFHIELSFMSAIYKHGTIMQTEITCKKIPCYMCNSACKWFIVKKAKLFRSYVKHFSILAGVRKMQNLDCGLCK